MSRRIVTFNNVKRWTSPFPCTRLSTCIFLILEFAVFRDSAVFFFYSKVNVKWAKASTAFPILLFIAMVTGFLLRFPGFTGVVINHRSCITYYFTSPIISGISLIDAWRETSRSIIPKMSWQQKDSISTSFQLQKRLSVSVLSLNTRRDIRTEHITSSLSPEMVIFLFVFPWTVSRSIPARANDTGIPWAYVSLTAFQSDAARRAKDR